VSWDLFVSASYACKSINVYIYEVTGLFSKGEEFSLSLDKLFLFPFLIFFGSFLGVFKNLLSS
jgi:hypothetical protein